MAKVKKFELEKKYVDYFNSVREELVKAEDTVSRIKGSKEWKKAYDYFSVCKHRGLIKTRPTKANGYKIYVIGEGETLYGICIKNYGNLNHLAEVCRLNNLADVDKILAGQKLILP